jgi:hypothetical protein
MKFKHYSNEDYEAVCGFLILNEDGFVFYRKKKKRTDAKISFIYKWTAEAVLLFKRRENHEKRYTEKTS